MSIRLLGVWPLGRFGPYVIIPGLCVGVSLWQLHQLLPLCVRIQWPIYSLQRLVWAPQQKQIDTYKARPYLAHMTHFKQRKKRAFQSVGNLEKTLVSMETVRQKPPWAIKLQSDVNLGCPQAQGWKAPFTQQTQIKQFVCQFTCHLNGFLFLRPLFK